MPIITTLVMRRFSPVDGQSPSASRATITWPTISAGVRLRTSFCVPVWQKRQLSVQPTWDDTHSVPRPGSGMNTVSNSTPGSERKQPFARAVIGDLFGHDFGARQGKALGNAAAKVFREVGHLREIARTMDINPVPQLAGTHDNGLGLHASFAQSRLHCRVIEADQGCIAVQFFVPIAHTPHGPCRAPRSSPRANRCRASSSRVWKRR